MRKVACFAGEVVEEGGELAGGPEGVVEEGEVPFEVGLEVGERRGFFVGKK